MSEAAERTRWPEVVTTVAEARGWLAQANRAGARVGLVPTMGALHAGHASLVGRAVAECDPVVLSIFVNPLQFGPDEDLDAYPRDFDRDLATIAGSGVSLVFAPSPQEMFPQPAVTTVAVGALAECLEGASRPGHVAGVATVVAKLFNIVGPCRAYFGEKDFQQLAVVRRMAADLSFPVEVVGCPIVREPNGLALSSRNRYLGPAERDAAPVLHRALLEAATMAATMVAAGERDAGSIRARLAERIEAEPRAELDYAEVVDEASLRPVDSLAGKLRLLVAARFGSARLIDNVGVTVPDSGPGGAVSRAAGGGARDDV